MAFSNWLCTNNTKNSLVKIVHPGGHVELHDRPVVAAEIMYRNPKCMVAHPNVFKQPWAIVAPATVLNLGQKFYVVPVSTIRKLQRHNSNRSSPPVQRSAHKDAEGHESRNSQRGWQKVDRDSSPGKKVSKDKCFSDENCFMSLISGSKGKGHNGDGTSEVASSSSSFNPSETTGLTRKRSKVLAKGLTKKHPILDTWTPSLQSITEEH